MTEFSDYTNRTICSVLEAMRDCHKTSNFSYLIGLIEEAQLIADRMEAGLQDKSDVRRWDVRKREMKKEVRDLEAQIADLKYQLEPKTFSSLFRTEGKEL